MVDDFVVHAIDTTTGNIINTGLENSLDQDILSSGGSIAFRVFESNAGTDLNGDGDLTDLVLHVVELNFDETAPTVNIVSPSADAVFVQNETPPTVQFACEDEPDGSGIASCEATLDGLPILSGDSIDTATIGPHNLSVTGTDIAGNVTELSISYTVITAQDAAELLAADVDELANAGVLNKGQAKGLKNKLASFRKKIDQGNINAARAKLIAFIMKVENFIVDEVLDQSEGEPLIGAAQTILDTL